MIASMTHELRTPLNGIIGLVGCVIEKLGLSSQYVSEFLQPANNCAYVLLNQINNILDSSKMKFKQLKINKRKVKIRDVFKWVFKLLERKAKMKNIKLSMRVDHDIPKFITTDD